MKPLAAVALLVVVAAAASSPLWLAAPASQSDAAARAAGDPAPAGPDDANSTTGAAAGDQVTARRSEPGSTAQAPGERTPQHDGTDAAAATPAAAARVAWPIAKRSRDGKQPSPGGATGTPAVTAELAFAAMRFVGVDPAAEGIWHRAINDAAMPAGTRSDLIEDLNQEGYLDNSRPTKDDLPLIRARLRLIERLAPHARDDVNASAFAEAYKDLLAMYVRLGGEPSSPR